MNTDRLAAWCRAADAVICWYAAPKWLRGKLLPKVKRAYARTTDERRHCEH
jgi:hypothetical protein